MLFALGGFRLWIRSRKVLTVIENEVNPQHLGRNYLSFLQSSLSFRFKRFWTHDFLESGVVNVAVFVI